jgi:hypothetical protein
MQNIETKGYGRCHKARPRSFFSKERRSWQWPFNFSVTAVNSRHREGTTANISVGPDVGRANLIAIRDTETFKNSLLFRSGRMSPSGSNFPLPGLGNDFGKLLDHEDTEQLMQTIKEIRWKISGTFDASKILQCLDIFF